MIGKEKHELIKEIREDKEFRRNLVQALSIPTEDVVNGIIEHTDEVPVEKNKGLRIPIELRDKDDEINLINLLIEGFDFNIVKKVSCVLPALDDEYDYYAGIGEFQNIEEMMNVARHTIQRALDGLWDGGGYLMCDESGELIAIEYTVEGQFTVWVQYDIEDKTYFGSLAWNVANSQNY